MTDALNLIHGVWCPPVVQVRREKPGQQQTPIFKWQESDGVWNSGDELPDHIANALPGPFWDECERHRQRRIGHRRAA